MTGKHEWSYYEDLNADGFYNFRNLHLNYYAVKALLARVYMWEGSADSKTKALVAATEVIDNFFAKSGKLGDYNYMRWMNDADYSNYPAMAMEQIFALNVNAERFSSLTASYLKTSFMDTDEDVYYISTSDTYDIYENSNTDYRFVKQLQAHLDGSRTGYLPLKLQQKEGGNKNYGYRVALMRMPEMYYIAAECRLANNEVKEALDLLTVVRNQRGVYEELDATMTVEEAMEEIRKEYRKEFLLEGVMFYYYKRMGIDLLPNSETPMTDAEYMLPYPEFELQNGRIQ